MRFALRSGMLCAVGFAALGCNQTFEKYPPVHGCNQDGGSCNAAAGGVGAGTGGGDGGVAAGTGGAGGVTDLLGTVHRITSPSFDDAAMTSFTGAASIVALPSAGGTITVPYGGTAGVNFDLMKVPSGPAWLFVQDQSSGGAGIFSTFSYASLPVVPSIALPVVDQGLMQNLASNLPTVQLHGGVSTLASHVVLLVAHAGAPYKGVSVTGGQGGAQVVYDIGPGTYSDSATATGTGGTIILFNSGLVGLVTVTLTSTTAMKSYQIAVQTAKAAVTLVNADLE